jgi:hypothetical protein
MIPPVYFKKIFFSVPRRQTCSVRVTSSKTSLAVETAEAHKAQSHVIFFVKFLRRSAPAHGDLGSQMIGRSLLL